MKVKYYLLSFLFILVMSICGNNIKASAENKIDVKTMDEFIKRVEMNLNKYNTNFTIDYSGDMNEFQQKAQKIIPTLINKNDLIAGTLKQYEQSIIMYSDEGEIQYKIQYFTSKTKDAIADKLIDQQVKKIKKTAKTDFDKVKAVNDYIVSNTSYGGIGDDRHTAYGLMQKKIAVCQGYALSVQKMLTKLNIPVRYVVGRSLNQDHAWNKVKVSGVWYNLDTTWNDPVPNSETEISYKYFLISDAQLKKTHTWKKANYPAATNKKYDFLADSSSAVLVGNVFYYSNSKDKERLYSYNLKTVKKEKLSNTRVQYLVYANSKLYFSNYSNGAYLYSMALKGKNIKQLNKMNSYNLMLKGSYLYFKSKEKNYRMKI